MVTVKSTVVAYCWFMAAVETEARDYRCPIVIRIDEELRDAIRERAREEDRSIASLIRTALRGYVNGR